MHNFTTRLLLNIGHALDHMFLLIFATAVTSISNDFGLARWEDLMPYSVAAFFCFGFGSLPSGRLGDLWGRRPMMIIFFIGIGLASISVSITDSPIELAIALAVLGCAASIYHPVGIPLLVQNELRPGWAIGGKRSGRKSWLGRRSGGNRTACQVFWLATGVCYSWRCQPYLRRDFCTMRDARHHRASQEESGGG